MTRQQLGRVRRSLVLWTVGLAVAHIAVTALATPDGRYVLGAALNLVAAIVCVRFARRLRHPWWRSLLAGVLATAFVFYLVLCAAMLWQTKGQMNELLAPQ